jgi:hypothetical protein
MSRMKVYIEAAAMHRLIEVGKVDLGADAYAVSIATSQSFVDRWNVAWYNENNRSSIVFIVPCIARILMGASSDEHAAFETA